MKLKLIENIDWNRLKTGNLPPPPKPAPKPVAAPASAAVPAKQGTYGELGELAKLVADLKKSGINADLSDLLKPERPKDPNSPEMQARRKAQQAIRQKMANIQHNYTKGMRAAGW